MSYENQNIPQTGIEAQSEAETESQTKLSRVFTASDPFQTIQRARLNPKKISTGQILQLQHTIGNKAVARLLTQKEPKSDKPVDLPKPLDLNPATTTVQRTSKPALQPSGKPIDFSLDLTEFLPDLNTMVSPLVPVQPGIQRALNYNPLATSKKADLDNDLKNNYKNVTRFQHGETFSKTRGLASDTSAFVHANGSDNLENQDINWGAKKIGYLRPIGKLAFGGVGNFDPGVKMHLVNSFLHHEANDWAENWVWGHGELNHAHDRDLERPADEYHPMIATKKFSTNDDVYAISYRTEVNAKAAPIGKSADDLATDITGAINYLADIGWTGTDATKVKANLTIGGQAIAAYHGNWTSAIQNTTASQVSSLAKIYGFDAKGDLKSEDVKLGPGTVTNNAPIEYRVTLLAGIKDWLAANVFTAPVGRGKRGGGDSSGIGKKSKIS
jgi:hypothetical protein